MPTYLRRIALCLPLTIGVSTCLFASTTGTITIGGAEQASSIGAWDTGTVTITVNGSYSETVSYGQFSSPASVASGLAAKFSQDCNSPAWAHAVGAQITFRMRASATSLASLQLTSTYNTGLSLSGPSFTAGSSPALVLFPGQPVIFGLLRTNGNAGTPITLAGINLGTSGTVTFNGVPSTATTWTPTSITVPIPAGARSGLVVVTTSGLVSNGIPITLTEAVSCPAQ